MTGKLKGQGVGPSILLIALAVMLAAPAGAIQAPKPERPAEPGDRSDLPKAPQPLKRAPLKYPKAAENAEKSGDVNLELVITTTGAVLDVKLIKETPEGYGFADAAIASVSQWTFKPGVSGRYQVLVKFRLNAKRPNPNFQIFTQTDAPKPIQYVAPIYPPDLLAAGVSGTIKLAIFVEPNGRMSDAAILGDPTTNMAFASAAYAAISQWAFSPTVEAKSYRVTITFDKAALASGKVKRAE